MIPEITKSLSGVTVTDRSGWEKFRREEIKHLFEHYVYGERPQKSPSTLDFNVEHVRTTSDEICIRTITVTVDGFSFTAPAFSPAGKKNVPVFLYFMHDAQQTTTDIMNEPDNIYIPISQIVKQGFAVIVMYFNSIYSDVKRGNNLKTGIFSAYPISEQNKSKSDWACISAWSYAASRLADYIETDDTFDKSNIAVAGHSRGGKTALWTGATDERFSYVISNSSGCTGAALLRGKVGEHLDFLTSHTEWLCEKYSEYVDDEDTLPVDQHMLLALIAPRLLYIQSSSLDTWADPIAERRSARLANEAYELYGLRGSVLPDEEDIQLDTPYHEGEIGNHTRTGEHSICAEDWEMFISFWNKHAKFNPTNA